MKALLAMGVVVALCGAQHGEKSGRVYAKREIMTADRIIAFAKIDDGYRIKIKAENKTAEIVCADKDASGYELFSVCERYAETIDMKKAIKDYDGDYDKDYDYDYDSGKIDCEARVKYEIGMSIGQSRPAEAAKYFEKAIAAAPIFAEAYSALCLAYIDSGVEAKEAVERVLDLLNHAPRTNRLEELRGKLNIW